MDGTRWRVIECSRTGELKKDDKTWHFGARVTESCWEISGGGDGGGGANLRCLSFLRLHSIIRANPRSDAPAIKKREKKRKREGQTAITAGETRPRSSSPSPILFCYSFGATDDNKE